MTNWVKAALTKDVSDDSIQQLNINGCKVALYRCGEEYFATSDVCTHAYALLSDGWLDGYEIECPLHGARFDVRTGAALTSPAETAWQPILFVSPVMLWKSMSPRHRLIPTRQPNLTARGATMSPFCVTPPSRPK
jgi:naphthalene 1,2-dioxygenase system ferredoxin subunit